MKNCRNSNHFLHAKTCSNSTKKIDKYLPKAINKNIGLMYSMFCWIFSNSTIKTPERCQAFWFLNQANIYLLKIINRNTRKICEICSKLTIETPERCNWHRRSGVFIINFQHILHLFLVFLLLILVKVWC